MKTNLGKQQQKAFTALELIIVLVVISLLVGMIILPGYSRPRHSHSKSIKCSNNLKQIALSLKMFAGDNDGKYPYEAANSLAYKNDSQAWLHFLSLSNELGSTKILLCPSDYQPKTTADNFSDKSDGLATLKNTAISYFIGLDAKESELDSWLVGDGRLGDVGHTHNGPVLFANQNSRLRWPQDTHDERPNIAQASGAVTWGSNNVNNASWPPNSSNRLLLPQ